MKKLAIVFLMLFTTFAWAGAEANPASYAINIHVTSCTQRSAR